MSSQEYSTRTGFKMTEMATTLNVYNVSNFVHSTQPTGLVTYSQYLLAQEVILYSNLIISIFGIFTNTINLLTFHSVGVKDSGPNISFFAITIFDMLYVLLVCSAMITRLLSYVNSFTDFPFTMFAYFLLLYSVMVNNATSGMTVYLAIQKCCCVALPLHFKNTFTPKRTILSIFLIPVFITVLHTPSLTLHRIARQWDFITNSSKLVAWIAPISNEMALLDNVFLYNILPLGYQLTVIVSVIVMTIKLKEAFKFRKQLSTEKEVNFSQLSGKELQVVKSVTIVTLMFIMCHFPILLFTYVRFLEPELDNLKKYAYIYVIANNLRITLQLICASSNLFIYVHFNSSFRRHALMMFGIKTVIKNFN